MRRLLDTLPLTLVLALASAIVAACGGRHDPAPAPPPVAATPADSARARAADRVMLPPPPVMDSSFLAAELAAELRLAADSAADEAALEELASAGTSAEGDAEADTDAEAEADADSGGAGAPESREAPGGGEAAAATWDIDVETYNGHDRVQHYLDLFQGPGRERMGVWLSRMPRYEAMIRERLQEQGLPGDLVYLALIESGFSNTATSRSRAVGMWQLMKPTARMTGLRVDSWVDERRDPYRATDAAVRHLKYLSERFGSVYLAAAAYNAGAGKVSRGLGRLPDDEEGDSLESDATFFRLYDTRYLRRETKDYVPKLIAAALIAKEPARYGFDTTTTEPAAYDSMVVPDMTGLDVIARLADTTVAAIRELNPQYLRLATPPGVSSVVRLPAGRGAATEAAYASLPPRRRVTFVEHAVARGETLSGIARRYGVSTRLLSESNPRLRRGRLRPGQLVVVPTGGALSTAVARRMADPVLPAGTSTSGWHRVRPGETLSGIADEYGVGERELRTWNRLGRSDRILAGQRLRVAAHPGAAARPRRGRTHVVVWGETLTGLAERYRVSVEDLRVANGMSRRATLKVGAVLRIPR